MMRIALAVVLAFSAVGALVSSQASPASAAFHCMRIHAVKGGFNGNLNIQYVELRMNQPGQSVLTGHTIVFRGSNGDIKATFTFPAGVSNALAGDSILIATEEFNKYAIGGQADFVFSTANTVASNGGDPLHPIQVFTGGKVHFAPGSNSCNSSPGADAGEVDSFAYGVVVPAPTPGSVNWGLPASAMPLPSDSKVHRLSNLSLSPSDNSTEYRPSPGTFHNVSSTPTAIAPGSVATDFTTPRNNARQVIKLQSPPGVGGVTEAEPSTGRGAIANGDDGGVSSAYVLAGIIGAIAVVGAGGALAARKAVGARNR